MKIEFDFSEVQDLAEHFIQASAYFDRGKLSAVLRHAVKPVKDRMVSLVPVSSGMYSRVGNRSLVAPIPKRRYRITKSLWQSIRIRTVADRDVTAKVLVGSSKRKYEAGWRAHFTDRGWTTRNGRKIPGKHFSNNAARMVAEEVSRRFGEKASRDFGKAFGIIRSKKGRRSRKIAA